MCWSESRNQKEFLKYPFFNWLLWMTNLRECDGNDDDLWVEWDRKEKNSLLKLSSRVKQMVHRKIKVLIFFKYLFVYNLFQIFQNIYISHNYDYTNLTYT